MTHELDQLAEQRAFCPMPNYKNVIDPNLLAFADKPKTDCWIASEFEISSARIVLAGVKQTLNRVCQILVGTCLPEPLQIRICLQAGLVVTACQPHAFV